MTSRRQRYSDIIARAVAKSGAPEPDARQRVYEQLVASNERIIANLTDPIVGESMRRELDESIAEHEARLSEAAARISRPDIQAAHIEPAPARRRLPSIVMPIVGLVLGLAAATVGTTYLAPSNAGLHDGAKLDQDLARLRPKLNEAIAFLERVRDEVEAQFRSDPFGLDDRAGKAFINLRQFSPDLEKQAPEIPGGVIVRATTEGYKILYSSPLCTTAKFLAPELVDPARDRLAVGCTHFGFWTKEAAKL